MLMKQQQQQTRRQAGEMIGRAGIHFTDKDIVRITKIIE